MTVDQHDVEEFLGLRRIAVIGVSDDPKSFARTVNVQLRDHGHEVVAVHPTATGVAGDPCWPDVASLPEPVDGAVVMVPAVKAATVVADCADHGIDHIWLFKGLGGDGALSDEALAVCESRGLDVVVGACPLMFLEPVGWFHRLHRVARRTNGSLARAS